jgi:hypothetical protein
MYTGTMIDDLIRSVEKVEVSASQERSFAWGRLLENMPLYEFAYREELVEVA